MRDLVIGHRRPGQPRPWRAAAIGLGLAAAAAVVAWFIFERSITYELSGDEAPQGVVRWRESEQGGALWFRDSQLLWRGGIAVLRARGSIRELGAAHGRLLAAESRALAAQSQASLASLVRPSGAWARLTASLRVDWRLRFLDDGLADSDRAWLWGLARGASASDDEVQALVRAQAVWDVGAPAAGDDHGAGVTRSLALLALLDGATGGRVLVGHALAAPGLGDGGEGLTPLVTLARPHSGHAWAGVGWAGNAGVAFGINARGLTLAVTFARTRDVRATRAARPTLLLARAVLEQAASLDEALRLLEGASTLGAASFLVVAGGGGQWAVVERTPVRAVVTRPPGAVALGDALAAPAFAADPQNDRARRLSPGAARQARAQELVRAPLASAEAFAAVLHDRRDKGGVLRAPGHRGVVDDPAALVAIIDPALRVLWVADATAAGRMRAFDLRYELEAVGERPAPPPDLAADPSLEPGAGPRLARARRELRAALRAKAKGQLAAARELADRALAAAPELPEALALAAELAEHTGDSAAAGALWRRWLDGGPDDPELAQRARAASGAEAR